MTTSRTVPLINWAQLPSRLAPPRPHFSSTHSLVQKYFLQHFALATQPPAPGTAPLACNSGPTIVVDQTWNNKQNKTAYFIQQRNLQNVNYFVFATAIFCGFFIAPILSRRSLSPSVSLGNPTGPSQASRVPMKTVPPAAARLASRSSSSSLVLTQCCYCCCCVCQVGLLTVDSANAPSAPTCAYPALSAELIFRRVICTFVANQVFIISLFAGNWLAPRMNPCLPSLAFSLRERWKTRKYVSNDVEKFNCNFSGNR